MPIAKKLILVCALISTTVYGSRTAIAIAATGIGLASIYAAYRWFHSPEDYKPTLKNMNTITFRPSSHIPSHILTIDELITEIHDHRPPHQANLIINDKPYTVHRGVHLRSDDSIAFIYSRGYAKTNTLGENDNFIQQGACAKAGHIMYHDKIIGNAPLISFDYPDDRRCFSFGQTIDVNCLSTIYRETLSSNPHLNIVLVGDCRGAKTALEFIVTHQPKNLKALIIMAPFISARDLTDKIAESHLASIPFSKTLLHAFFQLYFPAYDTHKDNLFDKLDTIPHDLPILIAHRTQDTLVSNETIERLFLKLKGSGNPDVQLVTVDDTTEPHSKLTSNKEIQRSIGLFLKRHDLPNMCSEAPLMIDRSLSTAALEPSNF